MKGRTNEVALLCDVALARAGSRSLWSERRLYSGRRGRRPFIRDSSRKQPSITSGDTTVGPIGAGGKPGGDAVRGDGSG